jgi:hypothetical protein
MGARVAPLAVMSDPLRTGWEWRKASWMSALLLPTDPSHEGRLFHAYDGNNDAACAPAFGLGASCEEPNEGSALCPECVEIVRRSPDASARLIAPR